MRWPTARPVGCRTLRGFFLFRGVVAPAQACAPLLLVGVVHEFLPARDRTELLRGLPVKLFPTLRTLLFQQRDAADDFQYLRLFSHRGGSPLSAVFYSVPEKLFSLNHCKVLDSIYQIV